MAAVLEIRYCCVTLEGGQLGVSEKISLRTQGNELSTSKRLAIEYIYTFETCKSLQRNRHLLCVALKDIHRMDRRISEIPQTEGCIA